MAGVRKMDRIAVDDTLIDTLRGCLEEGMSATEIGNRIGRSRNSVIGLIDRHIKGNTKNTDRKADRSVPARGPNHGSHVFAEPSAPRRFTFQDLPS